MYLVRMPLGSAGGSHVTVIVGEDGLILILTDAGFPGTATIKLSLAFDITRLNMHIA